MLIDRIDFERKPIKWLFDQLKAELLFVDNTFQRRYVWTNKNQVQLIESIIKGYPIPEIYVWERTTDPESGETNHSIIDGQQRLMTIFGFINNEFKLSTSVIDSKDAEYKNKTFSELGDDYRSAFWKYPFAVRIVKQSITRDEIVEMFLRLNKTNTNLNPQELRNAEFEGLFLKLAQTIADDSFWERHNIFYQYDIRRMIDIQFVSSILVFFRFGFDEEITQSSINRAYDTFNENYEKYNDDEALFKNLMIMSELIINQNPNVLVLFRKKTHLYTLFTVLYYFYRKYDSLPQDSLNAYVKFAVNYESLSELISIFGHNKKDDILEYKLLASEGTSKKSNRQRRFEIMKDLIEVNN